MEGEAADYGDVRESGGAIKEQSDAEVILPGVGDEFLGLFWIGNFVLEPFLLQLHTAEAREESSKRI